MGDGVTSRIAVPLQKVVPKTEPKNVLLLVVESVLE
jgi:hypothetical protein